MKISPYVSSCEYFIVEWCIFYNPSPSPISPHPLTPYVPKSLIPSIHILKTNWKCSAFHLVSPPSQIWSPNVNRKTAIVNQWEGAPSCQPSCFTVRPAKRRNRNSQSGHGKTDTAEVSLLIVRSHVINQRRTYMPKVTDSTKQSNWNSHGRNGVRK